MVTKSDSQPYWMRLWCWIGSGQREVEEVGASATRPLGGG